MADQNLGEHAREAVLQAILTVVPPVVNGPAGSAIPPRRTPSATGMLPNTGVVQDRTWAGLRGANGAGTVRPASGQDR